MLACMFISGEDKYRYGDLKTELINDYTKGVDNWSTNVDEAIQLLTHTKEKSNQGVIMLVRWRWHLHKVVKTVMEVV